MRVGGVVVRAEGEAVTRVQPLGARAEPLVGASGSPWSSGPMLPHVTAGLSQATLRRIELASGELAATCLAEMEHRQPWFGRLPADQRAGVLLVTQTGVANFVAWLGERGESIRLTAEAFRIAPHDLAQRLSLRQTVDLVRIATDVFEHHLPPLAADEAGAARARRGHPALRPGDRLRRRHGLRGCRRDPRRLGRPPGGAGRRRRRPRRDRPLAGLPGLGAGLGRRGGAARRRRQPRERAPGGPGHAAPRGGPRRPFRPRRGAGQQAGRAGLGARLAGRRLPRAVGHGVRTRPGRDRAGGAGPGRGARQRPRRAVRAARRTRVARRAPARRGRRPAARAGAGGRRGGPRPARRGHRRPCRRPGELRRTLEVYLEGGGALEACARALFVHPNTVRYRLRRVSEITQPRPGRPARRARAADGRDRRPVGRPLSCGVPTTRQPRSPRWDAFRFGGNLQPPPCELVPAAIPRNRRAVFSSLP